MGNVKRTNIPGLREGNLLSPSLFIIDSFYKMISATLNMGFL